MKNKIALALASALTFSIALTGCGDSNSNSANSNTTKASAQSDNGPIKVKNSVTFGATGTQADGAHALADFIKECSNGRLIMEFYPSSQIGDKSSTFEGLQAGTIEMTECAASDLSAFNDMWSVFSLPYLWDTDMQAINTVQDDTVKGILEANAEENGFKIIAWTNIGSRSVVNSKHAIKTPEDMEGLKLRCMEDPILAEAINALGAIGTPMPSSEVYTALQQGTIDGTDHTPSSVASNSWYEICDYYSLTEHFTIPDPVFVSKVWFEKLSPENQAAIIEAGKKFADKWNNEIWPSATKEGLKILKENGVEVLTVDKEPFKAKVQPMVEKFLADATDEQKKLYEVLVTARQKY